MGMDKESNRKNNIVDISEYRAQLNKKEMWFDRTTPDISAEKKSSSFPHILMVGELNLSAKVAIDLHEKINRSYFIRLDQQSAQSFDFKNLEALQSLTLYLHGLDHFSPEQQSLIAQQTKPYSDENSPLLLCSCLDPSKISDELHKHGFLVHSVNNDIQDWHFQNISKEVKNEVQKIIEISRLAF